MGKAQWRNTGVRAREGLKSWSRMSDGQNVTPAIVCKHPGGAGLINQLFHFIQKNRPWHGHGPERCQVLSFLLAVNQRHVVFDAESNQCTQGHFGGVAFMTEHGLPIHHLSHVDGIQPSHQASVQPGFNRMNVPGVVQVNVSPHHFMDDPCTRLSVSGCEGAVMDHLSEIMVHADFQAAMLQQIPQGLAQRMRGTEVRGAQHHAWISGPPQRRLPIAVPWKNAMPVSCAQCGRIQRTTDGQQARCRRSRPPCFTDGWKRIAWFKPGKPWFIVGSCHVRAEQG